ncbi:gelsolin-like protein 2 [Mizuhopecten yessoensis]|uniref:gelsolin-like protein 2 n=1 Tax=Mizuhopecten yessoensis TaxID=6573 RepID=UPI000B45F7C5|nr:gelsolin-like protein 2 [Mizuhopecten yessoensis]
MEVSSTIGKTEGLHIWRIVKFEATDLDKKDYGKFYDGDSYVIQNTYKERGSPEKHQDIHTWIGKNSTVDEKMGAARKMVQLDKQLEGKATQHTEHQGRESETFKSYFKTITYLSGGADSGLRHVPRATSACKQRRLLCFSKDGDKVNVTEIGRQKETQLDSNHAYILDLGLTIYQWNGNKSRTDERRTASNYLQDLKLSRAGRTKWEELEETDREQHLKFVSQIKKLNGFI